MSLSATMVLSNSSSTHASLEVEDLTYTAVDPGTSGNSITVEYTLPSTPSEPLTVGASGTDITASLATDSGTAASKVIQDLTYTAQDIGTASNSITITYIGDGTAGAETVDTSGSDITVHMDPTAMTGSTATDIATAVTNDMSASALVSVTVSGTGSNVQAVQATTHLTGGLDPASTSTADDILAAMELDGDIMALVSIEVTGDGSAIQDAFSQTSLSGAIDGGPYNSKTTATLTISNSGSDVTLTGVQPSVGDGTGVAIGNAFPPISPLTIPGSGSAQWTFSIIPFSPQISGAAQQNSTYSIGCELRTSDGSVFAPSPATLTVVPAVAN